MSSTPVVQVMRPNEQGHDWVVGDIHGEYRTFVALLYKAGFNFAQDRLFCVGDLVDRGPDSDEADYYLELPWFFAVRGNHEELLLLTHAGHAAGTACHMSNGGKWFLTLPEHHQDQMAAMFRGLPYLIEIPIGNQRIGIAHSGDFSENDWGKTIKALEAFDSYTQGLVTWGRGRARWAGDATSTEDGPVSGIDIVYAGHTFVERATRVDNVVFIDTGCCFGRSMTLVNLHTKETFVHDQVPAGAVVPA